MIFCIIFTADVQQAKVDGDCSCWVWLTSSSSWQTSICIMVAAVAAAFTANTPFLQMVWDKEAETWKLFHSSWHTADQSNSGYFAWV